MAEAVAAALETAKAEAAATLAQREKKLSDEQDELMQANLALEDEVEQLKQQLQKQQQDVATRGGSSAAAEPPAEEDTGDDWLASLRASAEDVVEAREDEEDTGEQGKQASKAPAEKQGAGGDDDEAAWLASLQADAAEF